MTINAPVLARIINPDEFDELVLNQHYNWTWGDRDHVAPPSPDEIWEAGKTAFERMPATVTFMVAVEAFGYKQIDFITGPVTDVGYESGATGMLQIKMNTDDKRWTNKIHGIYISRPGERAYGHLWVTPRR